MGAGRHTMSASTDIDTEEKGESNTALIHSLVFFRQSKDKVLSFCKETKEDSGKHDQVQLEFQE